MLLAETQRLATVSTFKYLKLNENQELNDLVSQISKICNTSMASLTLMDEDVQWIKCSSGIMASQENVEDSFCKYLLNTNKIMVVPNALLDKRFVNYPSVTGLRHIRFYAGIPLVTTGGYHLGALCVYDENPNYLTNEQKSMLTFIAKQVMHMMEMLLCLNTFKMQHIQKSVAFEKASHADLHLKAFLSNSNAAHLVINKNLTVTNFNKAASAYIKDLFSHKLRIGKNILNFVNTALHSQFVRSVKTAFTGKRLNKEILVKEPGKKAQWWHINLTPIRNAEGATISVAYSAANVTEQKSQVEEIILQNESLLKIANIQSHVYRKPVASILGLMNVIKANKYKASKKCLMLMENAVMDLDEKIKTVVELSEKSIVNIKAQ